MQKNKNKYILFISGVTVQDVGIIRLVFPVSVVKQKNPELKLCLCTAQFIGSI